MSNKVSGTSRRALLGAIAVAGPTTALGSSPARSELSVANGVQSRAVLAAQDVASGKRAYLAGETIGWEWQAGDFTAQTGSDPLRGLYQPHVTIPITTGCWIRLWDGVSGCPEWFGARPNDSTFDNLAALKACHALCRRVVLGSGDYYIHDTFVFSRSNCEIEGVSGSGRDVGLGLSSPMGMAGGSRIILTGPRVATGTIFHFGALTAGKGDDTTIMRNSTARKFAVVRDCTSIKVEPAKTADPIDCTKGVIVCYQNACRMEDIVSFDSPVGFHYFGVVYSTFIRLNAYRTTPASRRTNDFWIGHLVGGYSPNFYIAANASIYFQAPGCYDSNPAFGLSIGMRIFGYVADTFVDNAEIGRVDIGIEIDGRDAGGKTVSASAGPGAHQDVRISNAVIDGTNIAGIQIRNLNASGEVTLAEPYIAAGNGSVLCLNIFDADGKIRVAGGRILGGAVGANVARANLLQLDGTYIRDCARPVVLDTVGMSLVTPTIFNPHKVCTTAVELTGATLRCHIAPQIRAGIAKITNGVSMTTSCVFNEINLTMIDPGAFMSGNAAYKVRYNGLDARNGAAGSNITTGVQG